MISMAQVHLSRRECNEKVAVYPIIPATLCKNISSCSLCHKHLLEKHSGSCFMEVKCTNSLNIRQIFSKDMAEEYINQPI